ncbi:MAG TPA: patatin-like phospholipase family protein [Jatrophihabitans sp.]|jgi:NTE family protein|nr:patatin-like phospholipase family protein [Jatrophihabitans sp.]
MQTADLVLEGGGVKGAGLAGAVEVLGRHYTFGRVAGTSAGAIVASFIAAGLTEQLEKIMVDTNFADFLDEGSVLGHLGKLGEGIEVLLHEGIYKGNSLHDWIEHTLATAPNPVRTWGDLRIPGTDETTPIEQRYRLVVVVSDISRGRMLRLPWDYPNLLGRDPDTEPVADAVRASASIPFFFQPWHLPVEPSIADGHDKLVLTDGGMLSNYPIDLFDDNDFPTFGVKLSARLSLQQRGWHTTDGVLSLGKALISTMMSAHDQLHVDEESVCARSVFVDTTGVNSTDFHLSEADKHGLFEKGAASATKFLKTWDFEAWKRTYAPAPPVPA